MHRLVLLVAFLSPLLAAAAAPTATLKFPAPKPFTGPPSTNLQRTMTRLATSTPEKRPTVKILFYGQSITEQDWWKTVAEDLRRRFPAANLVVENRAIGGFAAQLLVKTAETDLYPFYPDLVIFHVYGSHVEYENIIRRIRERTTADILLQTDHITKDNQLTEETDPARLTSRDWDAWMNHVFLPATAKKYDVQLADVHNLWKQYLAGNKLPAAKLLKDEVHLNDHGNFLLAELIKPYLRHDKAITGDLGQDWIITSPIRADLSWKAGKLTLPFDGNRVDILPATLPPNAPELTDIQRHTGVRILIDGKRPSAISELYGFTRTTSYPGSKWPCLLRVGSASTNMQLEEWTLTLRDLSPDQAQFKFTLTGSQTGPDGDGSSDQPFVSRSGRVTIDPSDWNLVYALNVFKKPLPANFEIHWQVVPYFLDEIAPADLTGVGEGGRVIARPTFRPNDERAITIAQGLQNGHHTLELFAEFPPPIAAVRVYRPPLGRE